MTALEAHRSGDRSVLHVLPHPGGGGETYVDALSAIEEWRSDRVYLARSVNPRGARVSIARKALGTQRDARRHTIMHAHGEVAGMLCLPTLAVRPSVVTINGLHLLRRVDGASRAAAEANLRLIVRAASRTICVSQAEYDDVVEAVGPQAARRVLMIHNGVAPLRAPTLKERAAIRAELGIAPTTTVGVSVGALDEHKNPFTPIRAVLGLASSGADLALLIVGDGPLRPQVEEAAREHDGAVRVLGHRSDVSRILGAADFFVLSSQREGLSFALLEAMSLGLPAVVSDAPGNPEAVGDTGIVVPYGDVAGFAEGIARLLGDEGQRFTLGVRTREQVIRFFHVDDMRRRTRQVYDEVVRERHG